MRGGPSLGDLRGAVYRVADPAVRWLVRQGVHPNVLTTTGLLVMVVAALLYAADHVRTAGLVVLLAGAFDLLDGRVARLTGQTSTFGSFYDSTLDRVGEIVVWMGLLSLYSRTGQDLAGIAMTYVVLLAMGASLMVSYTRARAEALGLDCAVGLLQRPERIVLLGGGSLLFGLALEGRLLSALIVVVAVLAAATSVQRVLWVREHAPPPVVPVGGGVAAGPPREDETAR